MFIISIRHVHDDNVKYVSRYARDPRESSSRENVRFLFVNVLDFFFMTPNAQPFGSVCGRRVFSARHAYPFAASTAVGSSVDDPAEFGPASGATVSGPKTRLAAQHL